MRVGLIRNVSAPNRLDGLNDPGRVGMMDHVTCILHDLQDGVGKDLMQSPGLFFLNELVLVAKKEADRLHDSRVLKLQLCRCRRALTSAPVRDARNAGAGASIDRLPCLANFPQGTSADAMKCSATAAKVSRRRRSAAPWRSSSILGAALR
jgi:hypothetical protein